MSKISISAVSYTNTLPFLQGIRNAEVMDDIDLHLDYPSECARKVLAGEVDMGVIPVAALAEMEEFFIIGDFCIGSDGAVDSVFVFSDKPIEEITTLRLDVQSRTSNGLARVLLKHYWKKEVEIVGDEDEADAYVLIGDRTFGKKETVPYAYDLGYYWKELTGLPFAYAVWVANRPLPENFVEQFNKALAEGVARTEDVLVGLPVYPNFDLKKYLTENLNYDLDEGKKEAIQLYLSYFRTL